MMNWECEYKCSSKGITPALANFWISTDGGLCEVSYCHHLVLDKEEKRFIEAMKAEEKTYSGGLLCAWFTEPHILNAN